MREVTGEPDSREGNADHPLASASPDQPADATRLVDILVTSHKDDPVSVRLTPDEAIEKPEPTDPREPAEPDRMFHLDRTEEATIVEHEGRRDGETVFAGHGYRVGDEGWFVVPRGTSVAFYCEDGKELDDHDGMRAETDDTTKPQLVVPAGSRMPDLVLAHPHGLTVSSSSRRVEHDTRLSELLEPDMGRVHWAACRTKVTGVP